MSVAIIPTKISRSHLDRVALAYVRQSSLAQVREHTESTARQYGLAESATALGWAAGSVQGHRRRPGVSGRSTGGPDGFVILSPGCAWARSARRSAWRCLDLARSTADLTRSSRDALKGLPETVTTTWSLATVQACVVHLLRNTFRYASRKTGMLRAGTSPTTPPPPTPPRRLGSMSSPTPGASGTRR